MKEEFVIGEHPYLISDKNSFPFQKKKNPVFSVHKNRK